MNWQSFDKNLKSYKEITFDSIYELATQIENKTSIISCFAI